MKHRKKKTPFIFFAKKKYQSLRFMIPSWIWEEWMIPWACWPVQDSVAYMEKSHWALQWLSHAPNLWLILLGRTGNSSRDFSLHLLAAEQKCKKSRQYQNNVRLIVKKIRLADIGCDSVKSLSQNICLSLWDHRERREKSCYEKKMLGKQKNEKEWESKKVQHKGPVCEAQDCPSHWTLRGLSEQQWAMTLLFRTKGWRVQ